MSLEFFPPVFLRKNCVSCAYPKVLICLFLFSAVILSGCAAKLNGAGGSSGGLQEAPLGSARNPIVDSNMSLPEALRKEAPVEFKERQRLVEVLYYSFDGKIHKGQLVIDARLVEDIQEAFRVALETRFPIASVIPISDERFFKNGEWNEDNQSMLANNTSAFNYRRVTGGKGLSRHAYGFAIDINPALNPYIKGNLVLPSGAIYDTYKLGTLEPDSAVVKTFIRLGWEWGGNWKSLKDYQHFEKVPAGAQNSQE